MSFTTTSADNIITIGDTNDTIKLNKIMPMYTSAPTFDLSLSYIGAFITGTTGGTGVFYAAGTTIVTFNSVKAGVYLVSAGFTCYTDANSYGFSFIVSNSNASTTETVPLLNRCDENSLRVFHQYFPVVVFKNQADNAIYIRLKTDGSKGINCTDVYYGYLTRIG